MGKLDGQVAIVTGASRGLGADIALALGQAGVRVVLSARTEQAGASRIPGSLEETQARIERVGGSASSIRCDVTRREEVDATVGHALERFGRLDILVNNAGILIPGPLADLQPRHWDLILRVNLQGPFNFCQAAIPYLRRGGGGHIINISSRGAIMPGPGPYAEQRSGGDAYGATKAALERLSQGLARELQDDRISVNVLSPHISIWSEGGHFFRSAEGEPDYRGWRLSGQVIGDAAVAICKQEPGFYTGNVLYDELVMSDLGRLSAAEVAERYPIEQ